LASQFPTPVVGKNSIRRRRAGESKHRERKSASDRGGRCLVPGRLSPVEARRRYAEYVESGTPSDSAENGLRRLAARSDDGARPRGESQRSFPRPDPAPAEAPGHPCPRTSVFGSGGRRGKRHRGHGAGTSEAM
jgi:hypothetical protein